MRKFREFLAEGGEGSGKKGHHTDKTQHGDFEPGSKHSIGDIVKKGYKDKGIHNGVHVFQHHRTGHVHHFDQTKPGQYKHKYSVGIRKEKKYQEQVDRGEELKEGGEGSGQKGHRTKNPHKIGDKIRFRSSARVGTIKSVEKSEDGSSPHHYHVQWDGAQHTDRIAHSSYIQKLRNPK